MLQNVQYNFLYIVHLDMLNHIKEIFNYLK